MADGIGSEDRGQGATGVDRRASSCSHSSDSKLSQLQLLIYDCSDSSDSDSDTEQIFGSATSGSGSDSETLSVGSQDCEAEDLEDAIASSACGHDEVVDKLSRDRRQLQIDNKALRGQLQVEALEQRALQQKCDKKLARRMECLYKPARVQYDNCVLRRYVRSLTKELGEKLQDAEVQAAELAQLQVHIVDLQRKAVAPLSDPAAGASATQHMPSSAMKGRKGSRKQRCAQLGAQ
ncbi:hypothetical protein JKP88DRAFT_314983 [Tribonema minus]|uniref:Uncharacterized protein n=1 Tax=Tribonema minus TaxID=303371 RepID=A0A835YZ97_9STRA|nr:hypothetical protein JKP88DRAFT_314983 [Tribonema minus]